MRATDTAGTTTSRRGRPRKFDETELLSTARRVFWARGVDGVSLTELARITGVHKPSIYAAYGDKSGLFRATVEGYRSSSGSRVSRALAGARLVDATAAFLRADIALFAPHARGCYVIGVAVPAGVDDPAIRDVAAHAMDSLTEAVRTRVHQAPPGELPAGLAPEVVVDLLIATHVTIAVRARAAEPRSALLARARRFVSIFPQRAGELPSAVVADS